METITLVKPNSMHRFIVTPEEEGARLDVYLKTKFPSYSRSFFKELIKLNCVHIEHKHIVKPRTEVRSDDEITLRFPDMTRPKKGFPVDEHLNVKILHHNEHFLIIDKPAGLIVHPPKSTTTIGTLVDWLVQNIEELSFDQSERPGIVHRLDRDTSGIMLVAKNRCSQAKLSDLFRTRTIQKTYHAVVQGHPEKEGSINKGITRHPVKRNTVMCVEEGATAQGKIRHALTHYKVIEYFEDCTLIEAQPKTGRTHQIRAHFASIGHPLVGDAVYGKPSKKIKRHALHAAQLSFSFNDKQHNFNCSLPEDFVSLLNKISKY